jgi:hypothetical protein
MSPLRHDRRSSSVTHSHLRIRGLTLAAPGSSACADAIGWSALATEDGRRIHRVAVADGASLAYDARRWANTLVQCFVDTGSRRATTDPASDWLTEARRRWAGDEPAPEAGWFVRSAWERGSASTLCAIAIEPRAGSHQFTIEAVGDTCAFHIRAGRLAMSVPHHTVDDFGNTPPLVHSHPGAPHNPVVHRGRLCEGDLLLIATDGLSRFLLGAERLGHHVWRDLDRASDSQLEALAEVARDAGDDDIGFVWIRALHTDQLIGADRTARQRPSDDNRPSRTPRARAVRLRSRPGVPDTGGTR